jgi:sugar O-acyltransferase (sialic acid O-acetyltransferase NeuD family)
VKDVIFWGATGQAQVLREALGSSEFRLVAIFDNRPLPSPFTDVPIFRGQDGLSSWLEGISAPKNIYACVAVGGSRGSERLDLQQWLQKQGIRPLTVIHPRAFVASDATIGQGAQILAMSAVCACVKLGHSVIVNTSASVDHGCVLENGVHVGPGAHLAGEVHVDEHAFIGTGAVVLPRLKIGRGAIIGAGAVVTRDVASNQTIVGNPAKPLIR